MARFARLQREIEILSNEPGPGISAWPSDSSMSTIYAQIEGPDDSPYAGGIFLLLVNIPERYPFEPPRAKFLTRIYHPNIDCDGRICLDTLKSQPQGSWSPSININTLLLTIRLLMSNPNADDGLVPEITEEFKYHKSLWFQRAKDMTLQHASDSHSRDSDLVHVEATNIDRPVEAVGAGNGNRVSSSVLLDENVSDSSSDCASTDSSEQPIQLSILGIKRKLNS